MKTTKLTADEIRTQYTDAANDIEKDGFTDGYATAKSELTAERDAILTEFADDTPFAYRCVALGKTLDEARKDYAAHVKAENARMAAELEAERRKVAELQNGQDEIVLGVVTVEKTEDDEKRERVQKRAAAITNEYARGQYIRAEGFDPSTFTF